MDNRIIEIVSLVAGIVTIVGAISAFFSNRKKSVEKKKKWMADVFIRLRTISQAMGIGQLDYVLNRIYDSVQGKSVQIVNPNYDLIDNNKVIETARSEIEGLLNNSPVSNSIIQAFRSRLEDILDQYRFLRNDLGLLVDLCEVDDYTKVQFAVEEAKDRISDQLRGAIDASYDSSIIFDRALFLKDVIGIRFVDGEFPDYSLRINSLIGWLQETVLSNSSVLSDITDRRYKHHASPEALYEKAEDLFDKQNYKEAFKWYQIASNRGSGNASFMLGECYEKGLGCLPEPEKAADSYFSAAGKGLPIAMYRIGKCYEEGFGRERNLADAIYYYDHAAKKGYVEAIYKMGLCYWHGNEFRDKNKDEARRLIEIAAEEGHIEAQRSLSTLCYLGGDADASMQWAKKAAENGDAEGMGYYGYWLMIKGAEKSEYLFWLKKSAEGGCVFSQFNLGLYYMGGTEFGMYCGGYADDCPESESTSKAYRWFKKAAVLGDAASQYVIGMFELRKNRDRKAAEEWFEKALGKGFMWTHFGLGCMEHQESHYSDAKDHFEKAWDEGNPNSGWPLWFYYSTGVVGIGKDHDLASFYNNARFSLTCEWFVSATQDPAFDLLSWYIPPFDRHFFDVPTKDSTSERVIRGSMLAFMRQY